MKNHIFVQQMKHSAFSGQKSLNFNEPFEIFQIMYICKTGIRCLVLQICRRSEFSTLHVISELDILVVAFHWFALGLIVNVLTCAVKKCVRLNDVIGLLFYWC